MDDLQQLRVFREVIARKSFTQAAIALQISKASVTKSVAQLEKDVGVRLLNRSTRSVTPTDAGQTLAQRLTPLFSLIQDARTELSDFAAHPRGRLKVAAPHGLSLSVLGWNIEDFIARHPDVHVSIHLSNRDDDLVKGAIDVALRIGPIEDRDVIVRKLRPVPLVLCASPQYWARRGMPSKPEDLAKHDVLTYSLWDASPRLPFVVDGKTHYVSVRSRLDADDAAPLIALAVKGLGVTCVPEVLAKAHLGSGALVPVLKDAMPQTIWLYATYPHRSHKSAALRAFLEFLTSPAGC
ncbi:LysR family transcriptional regulator [Variovorax sp. PAMC26660]|uniref:LysR family transcriptional regulator n=1 Tax=Variovorax sp. PAMC26660 TaxID=2762322 RepID=UPI00164D9C90|nr:LysR family transcriptional regulator [Variovorax sp. PAMC26660]QNK69271.1 LysR family transcriptional regulator [Variovorax sp. PAMC26660]